MAKKIKQKKPRKVSDIYVGMLFISLVAFIGGAVLLYFDYSQYSDTNPPPATATKAPGGGGGPGGGSPQRSPQP